MADDKKAAPAAPAKMEAAPHAGVRVYRVEKKKAFFGGLLHKPGALITLIDEPAPKHWTLISVDGKPVAAPDAAPAPVVNFKAAAPTPVQRPSDKGI